MPGTVQDTEKIMSQTGTAPAFRKLVIYILLGEKTNTCTAITNRNQTST